MPYTMAVWSSLRNDDHASAAASVLWPAAMRRDIRWTRSADRPQITVAASEPKAMGTR